MEIEKKHLVKFLDEIFIPLGFKRKGNNWIVNGDAITKIINLQKSQYGNSFYINYGYVFKSLPLNGWITHIDDRLSSYDKNENKKIADLLNLESNIVPEVRFLELRKYINEQIIREFNSVGTEDDILNILKRRRYLYTIPPFVLKHFNLTVN